MDTASEYKWMGRSIVVVWVLAFCFFKLKAMIPRAFKKKFEGPEENRSVGVISYEAS